VNPLEQMFHSPFGEIHIKIIYLRSMQRGRRGRDRMIVGFTTTYAISSYHH